ncbi:hypothetical protein OIU84_011816 [Salix udensis]|uniref:Uncharacterized protein n=1 Tax=Salix udensis TaxID=889485 RepID=A0AAD6JNR3_9ROSI|nr:hypothetical protein OIU84_011816 [Salix udensis]
MNDEYIRKFHAGGGYFNFIKRAGEEAMKSLNMMAFNFSSWCKFPFYEADFGWGKPIRLSPALQLNRVVIFLDTADGEGIEAWISLSKEDMVMFEQHLESLPMLLSVEAYKLQVFWLRFSIFTCRETRLFLNYTLK